MKKNILMKSAAIAALFSLVALLGCNNNAAGISNNGSVTGQVFGYITDTKGEPVEGATVALGNMTTTTNSNGAFALTGVPVNAVYNNGTIVPSSTTAATQDYTLSVKKDGYLSTKIENIRVVETTQKSDEVALLEKAWGAYSSILNEFAKLGGSNATTVSSGALAATDGVLFNLQNTNDTFKEMANQYATILDRIQKVSKQTESTFAKATLTPCNGYFEGTLKITKSPAQNITTDASSIKAAPEGVKVKLAGGSGTTKYIYEATTDKDGNFKFTNLPINTEFKIMVEGFIGTYESGEGENKVTEKYYYSLPDSTIPTGVKFTYSGVELPEDTLTIKLDENSGAKFNATILLYSEPEKIIVTNTNLLQNTEVVPLALNTAVTVEFNKAMDYVKLETPSTPSGATTAPATVNELGEKAAYAWDETKKKVTITPKDGYWTSGSDTVTFRIEGRAQDGAITFIDNEFKVTLDNKIKIVFADTSDATADKFTLTFDRELVKTDAVKVTDNPNEALDLSWDKTNAAAPVLTVKARDGKFATAGEHTFTITGVEAKDQSKTITSYSREYEKTTAGAYTFKTRFDGFKATAIEVVDKAEGDLSRAVVATTAQYLKITFNKNIGDVSGLKVYADTVADANVVKVKKYIKDNAVYISLSEFANNKAIKISGNVISTSGDTFTGAAGTEVTWTDLLADYRVKTAYVIAASNLYTVNDSINTNNDVTVDTIKKGDKVTLTFNKDIPANAVFETELYNSTSVVDKVLTGYTATATASGKVVTVTLSETKPGETYYLSLKIKSADGAVLFSTGSSEFAANLAGTKVYIKDVIVEDYIAAAVSGKKYIKITVDSVKLLPEGSSKTTKAAEFKKSSKGDIVLQFNQDVTGYKAFLYVNSQANRDSLKTNFVNLDNAKKALFYGNGTPGTVDKDTITIKPAASFSSNDNPGIAVYDADGEWVELSTTNNTSGTGGDKTPYAPYYSKTYAAKLDPDNATEALVITANKKASFVSGTDTLKFSFDMPLNTYSNTLPQFYLYKKVDYGYGEKEWEKVATAFTITSTTHKVTKSDDTAYTFADAKAKEKAWITVPATDAPDFTYGTSEDYIILTVVNNMVIKSNVETIQK